MEQTEPGLRRTEDGNVAWSMRVVAVVARDGAVQMGISGLRYFGPMTEDLDQLLDRGRVLGVYDRARDLASGMAEAIEMGLVQERARREERDAAGREVDEGQAPAGETQAEERRDPALEVASELGTDGEPVELTPEVIRELVDDLERRADPSSVRYDRSARLVLALLRLRGLVPGEV